MLFDLRDRGDLSTRDKIFGPIVSLVQRFHCIYTWKSKPTTGPAFVRVLVLVMNTHMPHSKQAEGILSRGGCGERPHNTTHINTTAFYQYNCLLLQYNCLLPLQLPSTNTTAFYCNTTAFYHYSCLLPIQLPSTAIQLPSTNTTAFYCNTTAFYHYSCLLLQYSCLLPLQLPSTTTAAFYHYNCLLPMYTVDSHQCVPLPSSGRHL